MSGLIHRSPFIHSSAVCSDPHSSTAQLSVLTEPTFFQPFPPEGQATDLNGLGVLNLGRTLESFGGPVAPPLTI